MRSAPHPSPSGRVLLGEIDFLRGQIEAAEREMARLESRIEELTDALKWCADVFMGPRADPELREGWMLYVDPLLPPDDEEGE